MRCPICKGGHGRDSWTQGSLDKHMEGFHKMQHVGEGQHAAFEEIDGTRWDFVEEKHKVEAEARDSFVEAIDSMLLEADQREASEVLATIPTEEQELRETSAPTRAMSLSSKLCLSWLATVSLIALTLIALVLVTKV